jgi:hypothetical protein
MRIGSTLTIPAEPSRVFERFLDPETMRACIPGCVELERLDDAHYRGLLVNEIAHVRFNARFAAEVTEINAPHLVRAVLTGEDRRLGSSLKLNATLTVEPQDAGAGSRVSYEMDMALWGKLGRLGEPIVRRRSVEVERQFSAAFAQACKEPLGTGAGAATEPAAQARPAAAGPGTDPAPEPAGVPAVEPAATATATAVGTIDRPAARTGTAGAGATGASVRTSRPRWAVWLRNLLADALESLAKRLR